jgi:hypothetical protein
MALKDSPDLVDIFNPELTGEERHNLWKKFYVMMALSYNGGCRQKSADWMGITINTLRKWIETYTDIVIHSPKPSDLERHNELRRQIAKKHTNIIAKRQIEKTRKSFWFRQLSHAKKIEVIARINALWL